MSEITDEQARKEAAKLILEGKTLNSVEDMSGEMRNRVRELLVETAGQPYELNLEQQEEVLSALEERFAQNPEHYTRPEGVSFADVREALYVNPKGIYSLYVMERSGGAPDVIAVTEDAFVFGDCSAESPERRNFTYIESAKLAKVFGVELMSEEAYRELQKSGKFDMHSWSMLKTPEEILKSGEALMGDRIGGEVSAQRGVARGRSPQQGRDPRQGWRGVVSVPRK